MWSPPGKMKITDLNRSLRMWPLLYMSFDRLVVTSLPDFPVASNSSIVIVSGHIFLFDVFVSYVC